MVPKNTNTPKQVVHRRRGKESVCGAPGLSYGAGIPRFPYPTDWGKLEAEREYEWCENCIRILTAIEKVDPDSLNYGLDLE